MSVTTTFKKGQRFAYKGEVYELNQATPVCLDKDKCYMDEQEVDLRKYATYVEPFDEQAWLDKMAKRRMRFVSLPSFIFF